MDDLEKIRAISAKLKDNGTLGVVATPDGFLSIRIPGNLTSMTQPASPGIKYQEKNYRNLNLILPTMSYHFNTNGSHAFGYN